MARTRKIDVGWSHPETEEDLVVTLECEAGSPGGRDEPPSGPELTVLEIREDKEGGALRPDLLDAAEKALCGPWGDKVAEAAQNAEDGDYEAAMEREGDYHREERAVGGRW